MEKPDLVALPTDTEIDAAIAIVNDLATRWYDAEVVMRELIPPILLGMCRVARPQASQRRWKLRPRRHRPLQLRRGTRKRSALHLPTALASWPQQMTFPDRIESVELLPEWSTIGYDIPTTWLMTTEDGLVYLLHSDG